MLQFYLGGSGSGKSYLLHKNITEEAAKNPNQNYLYIVPDQFTMQTQIDLVKATPVHGIMNIDVLSFSRLAHRVFEELGCDDNIVLDDTGKSLILRRLSGSFSDKLSVIGKNINRIGYIHEIKSIISEFKQYDINEEKIDEMINGTSNSLLKSKLSDIKILYHGFNDYICNDFITSEETLSLLIDKIYDSKIVSGAVVVLDGFTGFTPVQYRLIRALMQLTDRVIVSVTVDIKAKPYQIFGEQELFYLSKKTILDLQGIAREVNVNLLPDVILENNMRYANNAQLAHLEKEIFRYPYAPYYGKENNLEIIEERSVQSEVITTLRKIKKLVFEEGYLYKDIAVVCTDMSEYSDDFIKYAKQYDIPIYLDETRALLLNPFIECIRSVLNIVNENFSYSSVLHFMRSGFDFFDCDEVDRFDNYISSCGIKGRKKYSAVFTSPPLKGADSDELRSENLRLLTALNATREKLMFFLEPVMDRKGTVESLTVGLYEFIKRAQVQQRLTKMAESFRNAGNEVSAAEYDQIYRVIIELLDQIYSLLKDEYMSLDEYIKTLDSGFDELSIGTLPGGVDTLIVGDIERSRIGQIKVLFMLGVNDGLVPKANTKGGLISDIDREILKENGATLSPTPREQIYTQRLYLYLMLSKPSQKLYISYSRLSKDLKSRKPSYLILLLLRLFPETKIQKPYLKNDIFNEVCGVNDAVTQLSNLIREYSEGHAIGIPMNKFAALLKAVARTEEGKEALYRILDGAFFAYKSEPLSTLLAQELYEKSVKASVTRLEKFANCAYAHFLRYGMKLKEREEFELEASDLGNMFHTTLELFSKEVAAQGFTLLDFPQNMAEEVIDRILKEQSVLYKEALLQSSAQNEYMLKSLSQILKRTVLTTQKQLNSGEFLPEGFEFRFNKTVVINDKPSAELTGKIDRLDICMDDGKLYVKIMDYKSSSQDIDLAKVLYGIGIQQPLYMMSALEKMREKYPEYEAMMGAMLYYGLSNPLVEAQSDTPSDTVESMIDECLRPKGLINSDMDIAIKLDHNLSAPSTKSMTVPAQTDKNGTLTQRSHTISSSDYEVLEKYTEEMITQTTQKIKDGVIAINPIEYDNKCACDYCEFKYICPYDSRLPGFETQRLQKCGKEDAITQMKDRI